MTPNFYPLAGIGSVRANALVRFFKNQGYDVDVITVTSQDYLNSGAKIEKRIDSFFEKEVRTIRIAGDESSSIETLFRKIRLFRLLWLFNYARFWDRYPGWLRNAKRSQEVLTAAERADTILCVAAPFGSILLGVYLKKKLGKKLVVDLRDPFLEHFGWKWPTYFHWLLCKKLESNILKEVDELIVVTNEMKNLYDRKKGIPSEKIHVITNGYD